jgi:ABC-type spermidine/putrescine transport system permease subunit I
MMNPHPSLTGRNRAEWAATLPSLGWLFVFVIAPTLIIFLQSFRPPDLTGAIGSGWTLQNWETWLRPDIRQLTLHTFWLSAVTTGFCVALAIPFGWFMARTSLVWKRVLQLLVIIPFWTNFLIRIFAWKTLLNQEGLITQAGVSLGLIPPHESLLYNDGAVLLVLIYTHLPFAILPIYAAAEKFDFSLLDATRDLGASNLRGFAEVFLPGIKMGIFAGALMVFVPALGSYLIPEMIGGHDSEMLGSRISQRAFADRNLPEASALASGLAIGVLSVAALIGCIRAWWIGFKRRQA